MACDAGTCVKLSKSNVCGTFVHGILLQHDPVFHLCLPDPLHSLGDTDIVGLKLVETPTADEDHEEVGPVGELADDRDSPGGEVVRDAVPVFHDQYICLSSRGLASGVLETHV